MELRVTRRPSSRFISARQLSSRWARPASTEIACTSPVRSGANSGSKLSLPERFFSASISSSTSVSTPVPMLRAPVASDSPAASAGDHVAHIYVVAGLGAVAEDLGTASLLEEAAEDRDHAGLAERVLAGAVDVAEPQRDAGQPV